MHDIHGDSVVVRSVQKGWFTDFMPDLNQENPFLTRYLIQNTIWWIEYSGLDGIREDTYPYADQKYLSEWAESIFNEYPNFNIVGEIWQGIPSIVSSYQTNSPIRKISYDSNLPAVTDFALSDAIRDYLSGKEGIYKVYETLAQDMVYSDSDNLLVFVDNHDLARAMLLADGNVDRVKIALNLVRFTRGIPEIFYGTEIGMIGGKKDGELRQPFPGGFPPAERDAFTEHGRTETENDIYDYLHELLNLRNEYPVLSQGKLRHIYPENNLYILEKFYEDEIAVVIINSSDEDFDLEYSMVKKYLPEAETLLNLKTNEEFNLNEQTRMKINKMSAEIFLVNKSTFDSNKK